MAARAGEYTLHPPGPRFNVGPHIPKTQDAWCGVCNALAMMTYLLYYCNAEREFVPTSGRQVRLPIFRCPSCRAFPDDLITSYLLPVTPYYYFILPARDHP